MTSYTKNILIIFAVLLLFSFAGCGLDTVDNKNYELLDNREQSVSEPDDTQDATTTTGTTIDEATDVPKKPLDGIKIVLDPGHGFYSENFKEPVAPGSSELKSAFATGTAGAYLSEAEFNLIIAKKIEPLLTEQGADVYFTRMDENSVSNVERAVFANDLNADLAVRIHADGSTDQNISGISVLVPAKGTIEEEIRSESSDIGQKVLDSLISYTDAENRGLIARNDLTGFNWSSVPVILVECGFMSNPQEDAKLSSDAYQNLIANGIAEAIIDYYK